MLMPLVEPTEWLTPALSDIPCVKEFVREFVTLLLRLCEEPTLKLSLLLIPWLTPWFWLTLELTPKFWLIP